MDFTFDIIRFSSGQFSTLGFIRWEDEFDCFTLEDEYRTTKVNGKTRIDDGIYEITLRDEGGLNQKYHSRFPNIHKGMLWLRDVEDFKWVYIHILNTDKESEGCIGVGDSLISNKHGVNRGFIGKSQEAYLRLYKRILEKMDAGYTIYVRIHSLEFNDQTRA